MEREKEGGEEGGREKPRGMALALAARAIGVLLRESGKPPPKIETLHV